MKLAAVALVLLLGVSAAARAQVDHILASLPQSPVGIPGAPDVIAPAASDDSASTGTVSKTAQRRVTGDEVLGELQKQLATYFTLKGDLKLSFVENWKPLALPAHEFDLTLIDYPADGVTGSFIAKFKICSGGNAVGQWALPVRAQLWQNVWVTQAQLARGQSLDRSKLTLQKVDVLRERRTYLTEDIEPDGYDVAQGINPGRAIGTQDVIERPLVHRGDVVEVVASHGALDIHMKALALEDGGNNALIKMRNIDSSKDFTAQVLNENQVKVQF